MPLLNSILIIVCLLAVPVNASETQHFFFKHGFTAPYNQEYVNEVLYEPLDITPKIQPLELTFKEVRPITLTQFNFYLTQSLDVYTTYRGLKYPCVYETNPVVFGGAAPSAGELILFKVVFIGIMKRYFDSTRDWEYFQRYGGYTTGLAVINNLQVIRDAKDNCPRGPEGPASIVEGPRGPEGPASIVTGPLGPEGPR